MSHKMGVFRSHIVLVTEGKDHQQNPEGKMLHLSAPGQSMLSTSAYPADSEASPTFSLASTLLH